MLRSDEPEARGGDGPTVSVQTRVPGTSLKSPHTAVYTIPPFSGNIPVCRHRQPGAAATVLPVGLPLSAGVRGDELGAAANRASLGLRASRTRAAKPHVAVDLTGSPKRHVFKTQNVSSWAERPLWTIMLR